MKPVGLCSVLALALSIPVQAHQQAGTWTDKEMEVVIRPDTGVSGKAVRRGPSKALTTCSLSFSPSTITNSQQTSYTVSYGGTGCVSGQVVETVTLHWASTVSTFGEETVRKKLLTITGGCLGSSGEVLSAPTALGINGTVTAQVEVRDWTGTNLFCTATGTLTVN